MSGDANMDAAREAFIGEARELLSRIESVLLSCEDAEPDPESINELFRAAHTIKGSAGLFGLSEIVGFTHGVETCLDRVRGGKVPLTPPLVAVLIECSDHMALLVEAAAGGDSRGEQPRAEAADALMRRVAEICGPIAGLSEGAQHQPGGSSVATGSQVRSTAGASTHATDKTGEGDTWHLSLRFGPDLLRNGLDPIAFIRYLTTFGEIVGVEVITQSMPTPDAVDPQTCYLGFEIGLRTNADKARIESAFEFVRDDSRIRILPPRSRIADYVALIHERSDGDTRLGQLLVQCGTLTARELQEALDSQDRSPPESKRPLGQLLIETGVVHAPVVDAALARQGQKSGPRGPSHEASSIRIDSGKLDQLIDLIGQLTLTGENVGALARRAAIADLTEAGGRLGRLLEQVRASALQLRMVQIGAAFSRFQRIVRDVSREIGKDISLTVSGADTELDKVLVEHIIDPLVHLVRNAIDHGIEAPEVRVANGKPAQGALRLAAFQEAGAIVIEVGDDGAGINRERVLLKARERGLLREEERPSDADILNLILQPGFSTADAVTNLSGRGVGMDVVKRNIEQLRGTLEIDSVQGKGSTFRIRLPLTLAVIDGFLVTVGGLAYVLPLDLVEECVDLGSQAGDDGVLPLRGKALPLLSLYAVFGHQGRRSRRRAVVIVRWGGRRSGLVVDELLGRLQTVIKPLSPLFENLSGITGSTVLGDGTVALILDIPSLLRLGETVALTAAAHSPAEFAVALPRE